MTLPAINGNTIVASDLYGLCQPSGGTEAGSYELIGWGGAGGDNIGCYLPSRSRGSTPVSVTASTSYTDAPSNIATPVQVGHLDANGVAIWSTSSVANVFCHVGSTVTWQY